MSIEYGLGITASDLEDEQLINIKKVRHMASVKLPSKVLLITLGRLYMQPAF